MHIGYYKKHIAKLHVKDLVLELRLQKMTFEQITFHANKYLRQKGIYTTLSKTSIFNLYKEAKHA